jgi:heparosan-N-sulfate-glucuronate 5-epimerase
VEAAPRAGGYPNLFSSAASASLPVGSHVRPGELGGYYIDFSLKAARPQWPPQWISDRSVNHVVAAQWGLGCFERHLNGDGDEWLEAALGAARHFRDEQRADGGWAHLAPMRHTYVLEPGWLSAMAQGEGASLLVRAHWATGDDRFAEAAVRALRPMAKELEEGGVRAPLGSGWFLQEYPTEQPSHVLNGGIFSLWGLYDVAIALDDAHARSEFEAGVDALAANIQRWDTGAWSLYDLVPGRLENVASSFYHALHIDQLRAMQLIAARPEVDAATERFVGYQRSRLRRWSAFSRKVVFRLVVSRNPVLAHRSPFARPVDSR